MGTTSCCQIQSSHWKHSPRQKCLPKTKPIEMPLALVYLGDRLLILASSGMKNSPALLLLPDPCSNSPCPSASGPAPVFHSSRLPPSPLLVWAEGMPPKSPVDSQVPASPQEAKSAAFPVLLLSGCGVRAVRGAHCSRTPLLPFQGSMTPTEYALAKCYLPCEDTVLITYCGAAGFLVVCILVHLGLLASPSLFGWKLLRKFKTR